MNLSIAEENYVKSIYKLQEGDSVVTTNALAYELDTKPASVTDMARKLKEKQLIDYEKYKGIALSAEGRKAALQIVRRHRLWECFLVDKLAFSWEEVHELAEELEHVRSEKLTNRLSEYLGNGIALREDFYMVKADGTVTLIMTNSNGPTNAGQIFNPIDTLPRKNKFSGDYTSGDMSLVSIRDGDDPKSFQFFITFSKDKSNCKGELSGKGRFLSGNRGEYKDNESSCGISFQFSSSRVTIREIGGCGAYRGIKCFFEGSFKKKVEKKMKK